MVGQILSSVSLVSIGIKVSENTLLSISYCATYTDYVFLTGSAFQWAAIFHKEDISFSHGHHDLGWYDPSEKTVRHKLPCKVSCAQCRTPIMDEGRNMILLFPSLIEGINTPEGRKAFEISCHMFYPQRVVDIPDGKPKWTGLSDSSDLLDEDGNSLPDEENKKRKQEMEEMNNKRQKTQQ